MIRFTWQNETASGGRTGWARTVAGLLAGTVGARAFVGEYLRDQAYELPEGTIILEVYPTGSERNGCDLARFWRLEATGLKMLPGEWPWRSRYPTIRERAAELLATEESFRRALPPRDVDAELDQVEAELGELAELAGDLEAAAIAHPVSLVLYSDEALLAECERRGLTRAAR